MVVSSSDSGTYAPLFSPEFQRDPYPTYRHYLAGSSLQPLEVRAGYWLLFGYEPCTRVIRDNRLSSHRPASALIAVGSDALAEFRRFGPSHASLAADARRPTPYGT